MSVHSPRAQILAALAQSRLLCKASGMAKQQISEDRDPRVELSRTRDLARRVRRSQRATWFPLFVFAVLTFLAVPVARLGHPGPTDCRPIPHGLPGQRVCLAHNSATFIYWPIALVLAYVAIAAFYARQSRARGVGTRVRPYVVAGTAIAIALTAASVWAEHRPPLLGQYDVLGWHLMGVDVYRIIAPACGIGLGLLVLAAVERNLALLAATVIYLVFAIRPIDFGWTIGYPSRWGFLPHLIIPGCVLLVMAIGFAAVQRPATRHVA